MVTETEGVYESHIFDAVMVCTGLYQEPYLPLASFPGEPWPSSGVPHRVSPSTHGSPGSIFLCKPACSMKPPHWSRQDPDPIEIVGGILGNGKNTL